MLFWSKNNNNNNNNNNKWIRTWSLKGIKSNWVAWSAVFKLFHNKFLHCHLWRTKDSSHQGLCLIQFVFVGMSTKWANKQTNKICKQEHEQQLMYFMNKVETLQDQIKALQAGQQLQPQVTLHLLNTIVFLENFAFFLLSLRWLAVLFCIFFRNQMVAKAQTQSKTDHRSTKFFKKTLNFCGKKWMSWLKCEKESTPNCSNKMRCCQIRSSGCYSLFACVCVCVCTCVQHNWHFVHRLVIAVSRSGHISVQPTRKAHKEPPSPEARVWNASRCPPHGRNSRGWRWKLAPPPHTSCEFCCCVRWRDRAPTIHSFHFQLTDWMNEWMNGCWQRTSAQSAGAAMIPEADSESTARQQQAQQTWGVERFVPFHFTPFISAN